MKNKKSKIKLFDDREFDELDNIEKKPTKKELQGLKAENRKNK